MIFKLAFWNIFLIKRTTLFNKSNSQVAGLENKIPRTFRLINKSQYDSDKQTLEKRI